MEPIRSHDGLFRFVFGEPEQMAELLSAMLPPAVAAEFRWSTLVRVDGTFVDEALRERRTDLLFEVQVGDVTVLLYSIIEHKADQDRMTALQMARYVLRVLDRWLADHPGATELPAVLPIVLHHGERPWQAAHSPHELVDLSTCPAPVAQFLLPHQMHLPFVLIDLAQFDEASFDALRLSAITGLTLRFLQHLRHLSAADTLAALARWQHLIPRLLVHRRGRDVLFALFSWYAAGAAVDPATLRTVMSTTHEQNPPMRSLLDALLEMGEERGVQKGRDEGRQQGIQQGILQGIQQGIQQGIEQGIQQGMRQGMHEALRTTLGQMLQVRFGRLAPAVQQRLAAADIATLQQWCLRLSDAGTCDDVFGG